MAVEASAGTVVVLDGARVGVSGEDVRVAERDAGVEGVGDGCVAQRVRADVSGDGFGLRDAGDHVVQGHSSRPRATEIGLWPPNLREIEGLQEQVVRPCRRH